MHRPTKLALALPLLVAPAAAQVLVEAPGNVPAGAANSSSTFQVDFADVDLDGDWDAAFADGADVSDQQNHLWINQGGAQAGVPGTFADETATRMPAVLDLSRDVDFADYDGDGDPDLFVVNTGQASRFLTNQGGLQGGSPGYFSDETSSRWIGLGGPGSSIAPGLVLAGGGWFGHEEDHAFADLDGDGDLDLVTAPFGPVGSSGEPIRLFLNDGSGRFSEFNPPGFQLTGVTMPEGSPGLWCEGVQKYNSTDVTGAECDVVSSIQDIGVGDFDGDFDLDVLGMKRSAQPRYYRNRSELGALAFRDVTAAAFPAGFTSASKYEQEIGDLDGDTDLDLYGVNWVATSYTDATHANDGAGVFGPAKAVPGTSFDTDAGELLDYDGDGDLDVFLGFYASPDTLMRNDSTPDLLTFQTTSGLVVGSGSSTTCWDADTADVDGDGDTDVLKAHLGANRLLLNVGGSADVHAPRLARLEQPDDHPATGQPTRIRVHVVDNASELETAWNQTDLLYSLNGGGLQSVSMRWSGGQVFYAELPSAALGNVRYLATSRDQAGNVGQSAIQSIDTGGGCSGSAATYCAGLLNSQGCAPWVSFEGAPSASAGSGFLLRTAGLVPGSIGLLFYSKTGSAALPFFGGTLCVAPPLRRMPPVPFGPGSPCAGQMTTDFNAYLASGADAGLIAGVKVWVQAWARDPAAPSAVSLSNAVRFSICP